MAEPCGCKIDNCATRANPNHVIIYCDTHMAAGDMLEALERAEGAFHDLGHPASRSADSRERGRANAREQERLIGNVIAAARSGAPRPDVLEALEDLLTVQPRPVKIPGIDMNLTVSYTEGDLLKMETAKTVAAQARGGMWCTT